jgi:hypothetical protein
MLSVSEAPRVTGYGWPRVIDTAPQPQNNLHGDTRGLSLTLKVTSQEDNAA